MMNCKNCWQIKLLYLDLLQTQIWKSQLGQTAPFASVADIIFYFCITCFAVNTFKAAGAASNPAWNYYKQQKQRGQRSGVSTLKLTRHELENNQDEAQKCLRGFSFLSFSFALIKDGESGAAPLRTDDSSRLVACQDS